MNTRAIRTSTTEAACDICGRTLLRGERAEIYLSGGARRSVCELCTSRALHGGWVREGDVPEYDESSSRNERRTLLWRRRNRRDRGERDPARDRDGPGDEPDAGPDLEDEPTALPAPRPRPDSRERPRSPAWPDPVARAAGRFGLAGREPRHVRAVPTSIEHKISSAVSLFNDSEHPRTVAGIGRSLGIPDVSVHPADANATVVNLIVAWELCWYRYEVDLSDEFPTVRVSAQGYELTELSEIELRSNAEADERGRLDLGV
ncbi:MAG: hypothetical protein WAL63_21590 [Solirubrobacteraceae bacterium]